MNKLRERANLFIVLDNIIIIALCAIWSSGCMKRITIIDPEDNWWKEDKTIVKAQGFESWMYVIKVEADSVYCKVSYDSETKAGSVVVIPLASIERIAKENIKLNPFGIFFIGMLIGGAITFTIVGIHISG